MLTMPGFSLMVHAFIEHVPPAAVHAWQALSGKGPVGWVGCGVDVLGVDQGDDTLGGSGSNVKTDAMF